MDVEEAAPRSFNSAQAKAIAFRTGPLRIIAGAGTGKSSTLVESAVDLVRNELALPEQILALTFTDAAAAELRLKMRTSMQAFQSGSGDIDVDTYNAFGGRIVSEHSNLIELPAQPRLLTPGEGFVLVWRQIEQIPFRAIDLTDMRRRTFGSGSRIGDILTLTSRLADEDRTIDEFRAWAAESADEQDALDADDYINVINAYVARKMAVGAIDFADQIRFASDLLERDDVREIYGDRYRFVLVDEYQDTNYIQRLMVRRLGAAVDANVRVVGDPYQAIYGFRGAAPDNLDRFADEDFPGAATITLDINYRSSPQILLAANEIWADADEGLGAVLVSDAMRAAGPKPQLVVAENTKDEAAWIADELHRLHDAGTPWNEMAILVRKNAPKRFYWKHLQAFGLPLESVGGSSLFEQEVVRLVVSMLRLIVDPDDDIALAHLFGSDRWGIDDEALYRLATVRQSRESLYRAARRIAETPEDLLAEQVADCLNTIHEIASQSRLASLRETVHFIERQLFATIDRIEQSNLDRLGRLVDEFESGDIDEPTVAELVGYIELKQDLGDEGGAVSRAELGNADTVKIMTVHGAKGLEWPVVVIAGASSHDFEMSNRAAGLFPDALRRSGNDKPDPADYPVKPKNRYKDALAAWKKKIKETESRRIAYVASTRARERLYVTWARWGGERVNPSTLHERFEGFAHYCDQLTASPAPDLAAIPDIETLLRRNVVALNRLVGEVIEPLKPSRSGLLAMEAAWDAAGGFGTAVQDAAALAQIQFAGLRANLDAIERASAVLANETLSKRSTRRPMLSHTQLDTFRACPHRYYLRYEIGLPGYPNRLAAAYGIEVHAAINADAIARMHGEEIDPDELWNDVKVGATANPSMPVLAGGDLDPAATYRNSVDASAEILLSEEPFTLRLESADLHGVIDRVQRRPDGTVEIVDFKTNLQLKSVDQVRSDGQLMTYMLALSSLNPPFTPQPTQATMVFLRHNVRVTLPRDDGELDSVRAHIEETASAIRTVTPTENLASEAHCRWCDFNRVCQFSVVKPTD